VTIAARLAGPGAAACGSTAWSVRGRLDHQRPQGGELPACQADLDVLLNDAPARVPPDSSIRVEVWRA
jgi:hypothetical protein